MDLRGEGVGARDRRAGRAAVAVARVPGRSESKNTDRILRDNPYTAVQLKVSLFCPVKVFLLYRKVAC